MGYRSWKFSPTEFHTVLHCTERQECTLLRHCHWILETVSLPQWQMKSAMSGRGT